VCQDIAGCLDKGVGIDAIITDFSKGFDSVPHHRPQLTELATSGVDSRVVVWVSKYLVGRKQRVRVGGQLSKEVKVTSGVPQGNLVSLLSLVYVNDIWRNIAWSTRLFADGCMICRKLTNKNDIQKLQNDLDTLG